MSTIVQKLRRLVRNGDPKNEAQGLELLFQCAEENPALVAEVLFPLEIIWYWASPQRHRCIFGKLDTWEPGVWTELYRQWLMEDGSPIQEAGHSTDTTMSHSGKSVGMALGKKA